jgi:hypothetical protein
VSAALKSVIFTLLEALTIRAAAEAAALADVVSRS